MLWIIIATLPLIVLIWLLLTPMEVQIDSRIPQVLIRWAGIGQGACIQKDDTWLLSAKILFFKKTWPLSELISRKPKTNKHIHKTVTQKLIKRTIDLNKIFLLIRTFRVVHWQTAIDTNDPVHNAWLYALNFLPCTKQYLYINYHGANYLSITIRSKLWKLLYTWIK